MAKPRRLLRRLARARSGLAMTEFALSLPVLFTAGLWGVETAYQTAIQMEISQLAVHVADNASRIGDTSSLRERKIYESDINDLFLGADIQGGERINLFEHGRVILSSLEVVPDTDDQQYIHWQRCKGKKEARSSYGEEGDGLNSGLAGMGPDGEEVIAFKGEAVMFVEIQYDYQPLISDLIPHRETLSAIASFTVRDSRDLSRIHQRDQGTPDTIADCKVFNGYAVGNDPAT